MTVPLERIISVLEAQHRAIDQLMAQLIVADHHFLPTKNPLLWQAVVDGHNLIKEMKG